ncbi:MULTISPECIES: BlaI/MecI/CopY family transcriptional regulator [Pontibacter]|uniref:Predicted transcriptional regulator n=1 Tax=Pontibacter lucknowensis TaxID=1077936 RepID=A0A1N6Y8Z8_9BACT|nr:MULTISPECIES: BlaI/MecI/CopY family transcriptional regulator [Pontibacter]EJF09760.1 CopY family transcriptional repressor [Pontibacter sp. BAB1700]SIR11115.1 Predicted transcriptional regulator [Pontibacter lucknowensis]
MKELTKAEEEIMQILWKMKKGFVKDILEEMPEPKPAYNTVSTVVRILEKKGFVGYNAFGKSHEYYPLVAEDKYKSFFLKNFMSGYFGGSFEKLVSFFAKDNNLDVKELDQLMRHVKDDLKEEDQQDGNNA